jgi:hypothetical protein
MSVDSPTVLQEVSVFSPEWETHGTYKTDAWTFQLTDSCHLQKSFRNQTLQRQRQDQHQHQDAE